MRYHGTERLLKAFLALCLFKKIFWKYTFLGVFGVADHEYDNSFLICGIFVKLWQLLPRNKVKNRKKRFVVLGKSCHILINTPRIEKRMSYSWPATLNIPKVCIFKKFFWLLVGGPWWLGYLKQHKIIPMANKFSALKLCKEKHLTGS